MIWQYRQGCDSSLVEEFCQRYRLPLPVGQVLAHRGITPENLPAFLNPSLSHLHSPFHLPGMSRAVERIVRALRELEPIMIYGDYDVDGITALAFLYRVLKALHARVSYFVPERELDGYGFSLRGVEEAKQRGCGLIITVDCGVTSVNEVAQAQEKGIDVIVTDHHQPGEELPLCYALIDPKLPQSSYPFPDLAGVGVAYKLAQGLLERIGLSSDRLRPYLDLVALGTAADVVPLVGENRVFVKLGLEKLNDEPSLGLRTLARVAGIGDGRIGVYHLIFILTPRLNAAGRMGSPIPAVELLITDNWTEAHQLALLLNQENQKRQSLDSQVKRDVGTRIENELDLQKVRVIVLESGDWHPGVLGIAASWAVERYHRPTILIHIDENGEMGRGSARSIPTFNLYQALKECEPYLVQYGGHTYAAGLTIRKEDIPAFRAQINRIADNILSEDDLLPKLVIDGDLALGDLDLKWIQFLESCSPFGYGNPEPVFASYGLKISGGVYRFQKNVFRFKVRSSNFEVDAVKFNASDDFIPQLGDTIDLAYTVGIDDWGGVLKPILKVKDWKNSR